MKWRREARHADRGHPRGRELTVWPDALSRLWGRGVRKGQGGSDREGNP